MICITNNAHSTSCRVLQGPVRHIRADSSGHTEQHTHGFPNWIAVEYANAQTLMSSFGMISMD